MTAADRRAFIAHELAEAERRYAETANPCVAWEALNVALVEGLEIPNSILGYLIRVSAAIAELSRSAVPRKGGICRALYRALEFPVGRRGRRNPFSKLTDDIHKLAILFDMEDALSAGNQPLYASELAAKVHAEQCERPGCRPAPKTVLRLWQRERKSSTFGDHK